MPTVVICPFNVVNFPPGGGHFWVYMQYTLGLRQLGCDVYWMEQFRRSGNDEADEAALAMFRARMERLGMGGKLILYTDGGPNGAARLPREYLGLSRAEAEAIFEGADLLLNFHYAISPALLARFRRTALVDIDPGLLQFWISRGQLSVSRHDLYSPPAKRWGRRRPGFRTAAWSGFAFGPPSAWSFGRTCSTRAPKRSAPFPTGMRTTGSWTTSRFTKTPSVWPFSNLPTCRTKRTSHSNWRFTSGRERTPRSGATWRRRGGASAIPAKWPARRSNTSLTSRTRGGSSVAPSGRAWNSRTPGSATGRCVIWPAASRSSCSTPDRAHFCRTGKGCFASRRWRKRPRPSMPSTRITKSIAAPPAASLRPFLTPSASPERF